MALPGKLLPDRPVDARPVDPPFPVSDRSAAEVIGGRFPDLARVVTRIAVATANGDPRAPVELRVLRRHAPVFDHGRNSAELAEDCPNPPGWCGHASWDLVCGTCRDYVGEPLPAPCVELVDLGLRYGVQVD